jgi:hypothetical protein
MSKLRFKISISLDAGAKAAQPGLALVRCAFSFLPSA